MKLSYSVFIFFFLIFSLGVSAQTAEPLVFELKKKIIENDNSIDLEVRLTERGGFVSSVTNVNWYFDEELQGNLNNFFSVVKEITNLSGVTRVDAEITYLNSFNRIETKKLTLYERPILFDLVWEADSFTGSSLYQGYPLLAEHQNVKVSAIIRYLDSDDYLLTEKDFSFSWEVEAEKFPRTKYIKELASYNYKTSGLGANTILIPYKIAKFQEPLSIKATARSSTDGGISFSKTIHITTTPPRVILYEQNLLNGVNNDSTIGTSFKAETNPLSLIIYPYYFSKESIKVGDVIYNWFVDDSREAQKEGSKIDISYKGNKESIPFQIVVENKNNVQYSQYIKHEFEIDF